MTQNIAALAPWACDPAHTRGRRHPEPPAPTRTDFQRDRDRIVHSSAFRRLVYKTQVFLNHEGDMFRTRLTHSLEVAQLARSIARSLRINEDLVEAISLAHDLGHTPFGHAGQDALNACMADYGGFEHNLQSLRVVDALEERYPQYDGLNLTFETREGILKHCARANALILEAQEPGGVGQRFVLRQQPSLEAQLCNLADAIAYNAHDIDDGVRSGLITMAQLRELPLFERYRAEAQGDVLLRPELLGPDHDPLEPLVPGEIFLGKRRALVGQVGLLAHHGDPALESLLPQRDGGLRTGLLPGLLCQIFGSTVQRIKVIAVGKEEIAHRLKWHLPMGRSG